MFKATDIMLDLETLGTSSNAVIVSISAVVFDRATGETGAEFEVGVNLDEQLAKGAVIDGSTVMWWLTQDKEAQDELTRLEPLQVDESLDLYKAFVRQAGVDDVWGNGATFDNVILSNLFKRHERGYPTPFWADRCVRTFVDLSNIDTRKIPFVGVKHRGIDDCKHQIRYMGLGFGYARPDTTETNK